MDHRISIFMFSKPILKSWRNIQNRRCRLATSSHSQYDLFNVFFIDWVEYWDKGLRHVLDSTPIILGLKFLHRCWVI